MQENAQNRRVAQIKAYRLSETILPWWKIFSDSDLELKKTQKCPKSHKWTKNSVFRTDNFDNLGTLGIDI